MGVYTKVCFVYKLVSDNATTTLEIEIVFIILVKIIKLKKTYQINQLRDYSTLFSRSEVNRLIKSDFNSINLKIKRYDSNLIDKNFNYLKYIYKIMRQFYANEYIYKNEFLNKWLIKELGTSQSIIYNELRLGKAIADLVMFNGCSRVFEIKTLLDKEYRLSSQLNEYKKVFNEIYLIVPDSKLDLYNLYDESIGLITYNQELKEFVLHRNAIKNLNIDSNSLMQMLHTKEYRAIIAEHYGEIPSCNDFQQYQICKNLMEQIPSLELNSLFIQTMKKRKINNDFSSKKFEEFNQICLSLNLDSKQKTKLFSNLSSPISY